MTEITNSQFYMWRAIFALAHADDIVTDEEIKFMVEALEDVPFSAQQRATLVQDISKAQDIEDMFLEVTDSHDKADFFDLARKMVWVDGDYGPQERSIMLKLKEMHVQTVDIDGLVGHVDLEFQDEPPEETGHEAVLSFKSSFLKRIFG